MVERPEPTLVLCVALEAEGDVVVYLDQSRLGGPESLRTIQVTGVTVVRHYSASEAEARFGPGHLHGAIQVITTR